MSRIDQLRDIEEKARQEREQLEALEASQGVVQAPPDEEKVAAYDRARELALGPSGSRRRGFRLRGTRSRASESSSAGRERDGMSSGPRTPSEPTSRSLLTSCRRRIARVKVLAAKKVPESSLG